MIWPNIVKWYNLGLQFVFCINIAKMPSFKDNPRTGVRANFFLGGGAEPSLPENFFDSAYFARLTLLSNYYRSKIPGFRALYLVRQNEFRFSFV